MGIDPLSPIASARINTLVVPAGNVSRTKFSSFVSRLEREKVVRLGDVSPDQSKTSKSIYMKVNPLSTADRFCAGRYIFTSSVS